VKQDIPPKKHERRDAWVPFPPNLASMMKPLKKCTTYQAIIMDAGIRWKLASMAASIKEAA
jgi:hypothetical protein